MSAAEVTTPSVADVAIHALVPGGDEPYALLPSGAAKVEAALAEWLDRPELREVVLELVSFAQFLEVQRRSPRAAAVLLAVAATATEALRRGSAPESMERIRQRAGAFSQLMGLPRQARWTRTVADLAAARPSDRSSDRPSVDMQQLRMATLARRMVG